MKNLWKRIRNAAEGFTLVELIVVIAILAILAGVAIPAYSGYIKRADEAADLSVLSAINTAFAAACIEHGTDVNNVNAAGISLENGTAVITSVDFTNNAAAVNESFQAYLSGTTVSFKTITGLVFDSAKHAFVDPAKATSVSVKYGNTTITISGEVAQQLANSSFGEIGAEKLLDKVGAVADIATAIGDKSKYVTDADLKAALGMTDAEYTAFVYGDNPMMPNMDRYNQILANEMILSAAENTAGLNLTTDSLKGVGVGDLESPEGLAKAAALYGLYNAYKGGDVDTSSIGGLSQLADISSDAGFQAYLDSTEGAADLEAYKAAMDVVAESGKNPTDRKDLLENGFRGDELEDLLAGFLGK